MSNRKAIYALRRRDTFWLTFMGISVIVLLCFFTGASWLLAVSASSFMLAGAMIYDLLIRRDYVKAVLSSRGPDPQAVARTAESELADVMMEPILIMDASRRIRYINKPAKTLLGVERGSRFTGVIRQPEVTEMLDEALAGNTPEPVDFEISSPVERNMSALARPLSRKTRNGVRRVLLILTERTETVRALTLRGDFVANASHELKTPVASLLGYIETLQGHAKDDPKARAKFLGIMKEQAERMQRLISDLLSLSHIEQFQHIAPDDNVDFVTVITAAREAIEPLAKESGVTLRVQMPEGLSVTGHHDQLVQVVVNLLDNAVKVLPSGGEISVTLKACTDVENENYYGGHADLASAARYGIVPVPVRQSGDGLPANTRQWPRFSRNHLPRLGERFYRLSGDRTGPKRGTGLGLAIIKHIVMRHRGGLLIESAKGKGTEFTVLIPAKSEAKS